MLPADENEELTEEEDRLNDEIVGHPTRDDWHEQRERGQVCEAVLHARSTIVVIGLTHTTT